MESPSAVIDAFYNNFLLRDLCAKIAPGCIVVLAACYRPSYDGNILGSAGKAGWPILVVALGMAWIVGFGVQQLGEWLRLLKHNPPGYSDKEMRYGLRISFRRIASPGEAQQVERFAVVKEATGNAATAILAGVAIALARTLLSHPGGPIPYDRASGWFTVGLLLLLAGALIKQNRSHAEKEYKFMESVIKSHKIEPRKQRAD
jgi:hypothetical protein